MEEGYNLGRDKGYKEYKKHKAQEEEDEAKKAKNQANEDLLHTRTLSTSPALSPESTLPAKWTQRLQKLVQASMRHILPCLHRSQSPPQPATQKHLQQPLGVQCHPFHLFPA